LEISPEQVAQCIEEVGVGFMFAPKHHSAMKHAIGPRREMGVRTIFNVLGPLTNPASAPNQVLGVFNKELVEPLAQVLGNLGSEHVLVVHADDGMDEISIGSPSYIAELKEGNVTTYTITPEQFDIERSDVDALVVDDAEQSLKIIHQVFENTPGPSTDVVLLNAGAAIYAAGIADSLGAGIGEAKKVIESGVAAKKLEQLVALTKTF
jgi:anthranilate phosphoribosyltransferase